MRYATVPEKVKHIVKKGDLEKAIATIPAQLRDDELDVVISNFRATKRDYLVGKTTSEKYEIARTNCTSYLLEYWLK